MTTYHFQLIRLASPGLIEAEGCSLVARPDYAQTKIADLELRISELLEEVQGEISDIE